jgi:hypothetical protein
MQKTLKNTFLDRLRASAFGRENAQQHRRGGKQIFSQLPPPPHDGYKKTQNFLLISKMQNAPMQNAPIKSDSKNTC